MFKRNRFKGFKFWKKCNTKQFHDNSIYIPVSGHGVPCHNSKFINKIRGIVKHNNIFKNDKFRNNIFKKDKFGGEYRINFGYIRDELITPESFCLSHTPNQILTIDNAGGNSEYSEIMSIELYIRLFNISNIVNEMDVEYYIDYKMIDFLCIHNNYNIGVSVTRAMGFPKPDVFSYRDGLRLLNRKVKGLILARNSTTDKHYFKILVLHIWCQTNKIADMMEDMINKLNIKEYKSTNKNDVLIIHLTTCQNKKIFTNKL